MKRSSLLCCLTLLLLACGSLDAATRYVDPDCTNAITVYDPTGGGGLGACTGGSSTSYSTIANGLSGMAAGDTLQIRYNGGTPYVTSMSTSIKSGSSGAPTVIMGYPGETKPIIRPASGTTRVVDLASKVYVTLDGLDLDGINVDFEGIKATNCHHIRVLNSRIRNAAGSGILFTQAGGPGCADSDFINNEIDGNGFRGTLAQDLNHGLYMAVCTRCLYEYNHIHGNAGHGLKITDAQDVMTSNDNSIVRFNEVHGNSQTNTTTLRDEIILGTGNDIIAHDNVIYDADLACISTWRSNRTRIYHNTCYNQTSAGGNFGGIRVREQTTNAQVYNNIVHTAAAACIRVGQNGATSTDIRNNTCRSTTGTVVTTGSTGTTESNTVTTDPLLVNPGSQLFGLQTSSPAIDAGFAIPALSGYTRPCNSTCDKGAFETWGPTSGGGTVDGDTWVLSFLNTRQPLTSGSAGFTIQKDTAGNGTFVTLSQNSLTVTGNSQITIVAATAAGSSDAVRYSYSQSTGNACDAVIGVDNCQELSTVTNKAISNITSAGSSPTVTQVHFQLCQPNREEGVLCQTEDTHGEIPSPGCINVRLGVGVADAPLPEQGFVLGAQFDGAGGYAALTADPTEDWYIGPHLLKSFGDPTTNQLSLNGRSFAGGNYVVGVSGQWPPLAIGDGEQGEWEYPVCAKAGLSDSAFIELRLLNPDDSALNGGYGSATPRIDIGPATINWR